MKLLVTPRHWIAALIQPGLVRLAPGRPQPAGWWRLRICSHGASNATPALLHSVLVDAAPHSSHLLAGRRAGESELIFQRHQTLAALELRFDEAREQTGTLSFEIRRVPEAQAILLMLLAVSRRDRQKKQSGWRVFEKSWARRRRHGWDGFLSRLRQEYHPLEAHHAAGPDPYGRWIESVEEPARAALDASLAGAGPVPGPLLSVLMPTYDTPPRLLREAIASVCSQSYPHWELCIADDASGSPAVRQILDEYRLREPRIQVTYRSTNGHISRASNTALEMAQAAYVLLLDHDDKLAEHALLHIARALEKHPDSQILYSDEDKIDAAGRRFDPHFKSDWNPDLLYAQNYVSHLGVYRRSLLLEIGGFRCGVEGSQDHDLLLRCLPHVRPAQIVHVPHVLYHWRALEGSTALAAVEKGYTGEAGLRALQDYFAAAHPEVHVSPGALANTYRVLWPLPRPAPLVSLLIPTRDRRALTETCVRSILDKTAYTNFEILILDNGSVEADTLAFFTAIQQEDARVRVLRYEHPFNYSAINNFGVKHARGEIIGLLNNDLEVISPEWLGEMLSHALRPDIGCVGAKLYYANDSLQHGGVILGIGGVAGHSHKHFPRGRYGYFSRLMLTQNLSAVTAACLLVRRALYEQVGGLDAQNLPIAFNDVDFCLKVREAGYRNLWTPYAELYHHESISRGSDDTPEKQARFQQEVRFMQQKWGRLLDTDPYYSPHLSRERENFSIAVPRPSGNP